MDLSFAIRSFQRQAEAIRALATVADDQARWKPRPDAWSILEVVNHLADEESEDFRLRLQYTLFRPGEAWPPIDPAGWVISRDYNHRDPGESLNRFLRERETSLDWLRSLGAPDWNQAYSHPAVGLMTAADLLASWLAHDGLHLRQLIELHRAYLDIVLPDRRLDYAGEW